VVSPTLAPPGAPSKPASSAVIDADLPQLPLHHGHPVGAAGWLLQHRSGALQAEFTEALAQLLLACSALPSAPHGATNEKTGELTLKLRVQANPDDPAQLVISDQLTFKLPPRATAAAYLFDADAMRISVLPSAPHGADLAQSAPHGADLQSAPHGATEQPGQLSIPLTA
jgi:hypothetical protein